MANNLFISYDLKTPGQNYQEVLDAIKRIGAWAKVHYSLWYVSSYMNAEQAAKQIWQYMDENDTLIVINTSTNEAYWYNLDSNVSPFIQAHWRK